MTLAAIHAAIPHREPFLMIDEIVQQDADCVVCRKTFSGDEWWFRGHYPETPIMPGVLLCEAAMQAGAVLLASRIQEPGDRVPVATRAEKVHFKRMVLPGDTITIEARLNDELSGAYYLTGRVLVDGKLAARLDFACTLAERPAP